MRDHRFEHGIVRLPPGRWFGRLKRLPSHGSSLVRPLLIGAALGLMVILLVLPLVVIFAKAFSEGLVAFFAAVSQPDTLSDVRVSAVVVAIAVPLNVLFGLLAGWAVGKFQFPGKNLVKSLIDLPLTVSPVVAGLVFVLLLGGESLLGRILEQAGVKTIFAVPGLVIVTSFVTLPYVAREVITHCESRGNGPEEAALVLGASGWQTFLRVTVPGLRWSLLYGTVLAGARALGEFGAVSVVSGHIRGRTNTVPLHVEILYNEYAVAAAFAVASLLVLVAVLSLWAKALLGRRAGPRGRAGAGTANDRGLGWEGVTWS